MASSESNGKSSVRNGEAGKPASLIKLGTDVSSQPKRTASGAVTSSEDTITFPATILAVAGTNFLSSPQIEKQLSGCSSRDFNPSEKVKLKANFPLINSADSKIGPL